MIMVSIALFVTTSSIDLNAAHAETNLSEKWNSQKTLSEKDKKNLLKRYDISGASSLYYMHKNLHKDLFNERYSFTFEPNSYKWKEKDYLKYDVKLKSAKEIILKKVKITVGSKSESLILHYSNYYNGFVSAEADKNNTMQYFLTKNIRISKKATITFYINNSEITKTLNTKQKEAILDNITLHTKVLH